MCLMCIMSIMCIMCIILCTYCRYYTYYTYYTYVLRVYVFCVFTSAPISSSKVRPRTTSSHASLVLSAYSFFKQNSIMTLNGSSGSEYSKSSLVRYFILSLSCIAYRIIWLLPALLGPFGYFAFADQVFK